MADGILPPTVHVTVVGELGFDELVDAVQSLLLIRGREDSLTDQGGVAARWFVFFHGIRGVIDLFIRLHHEALAISGRCGWQEILRNIPGRRRGSCKVWWSRGDQRLSHRIWLRQCRHGLRHLRMNARGNARMSVCLGIPLISSFFVGWLFEAGAVLLVHNSIDIWRNEDHFSPGNLNHISATQS